jgi:antirestriction protein ArdC
MADQQRNIDVITEQLKEGVRKVCSSQSYQDYLKAMARFHHYSVNNSILIWMQKPDATLVAGYQKWRNEFGRYVCKGEKGIRIFAPIRRKVRVQEEDEEEEDKEKSILKGFRCATVFDISQTEGKELPSFEVDRLHNTVKDYDRFKETLELVSPVPIHIHHIDSTACGYYRTRENDIVITDTISQAQTIKTMVHEITHALLHRDTNASRNVQEVEAESVAYAVCAHYGIDTSSYSFPYIATWSKDKDIPELCESLSRIRTTVDQIITMIEDVRNPYPCNRMHTLDTAHPF